ncbi:hypothetical protein [Bacillus cereus]|uniref:hypothetical protein n=1 Tax=Bacillus cereus TaxID=1396 RepID=UPI001C8B3B71|nr:hypothetical protein [Bacillus cereus]MBX9158386.1 hypothetical protein [Bacillus cereus]
MANKVDMLTQAAEEKLHEWVQGTVLKEAKNLSEVDVSVAPGNAVTAVIKTTRNDTKHLFVWLDENNVKDYVDVEEAKELLNKQEVSGAELMEINFGVCSTASYSYCKKVADVVDFGDKYWGAELTLPDGTLYDVMYVLGAKNDEVAIIVRVFERDGMINISSFLGGE